MNKEKRPNRLIEETSPYLLQHAHNPVDWYPWGDAAFDEAKRSKKPVLLSIGYSACHWCHVMAHESFENEAIARIMNEHFVNIKVDREERPDLDQIYQTAVQFFIRRGGGWPLTMFLTPEKVPFHGGTYFPPEDRFQLPGFPKVLLSLAQVYRERSDDVKGTAKKVLSAMSELKKDHSRESIDPKLLALSVEGLTGVFDAVNGGFGGAPKFPGTPALNLLLRHYDQSKALSSLEMVTYSLRKMACGGVYDQFGGGFHRYSVDESWQVPHFEKMLYDNAQLAPLYFEAHQVTGDLFFKGVGMETLDYVLREMTDQHGGFYAAQDADSEGGEGSYYTWSPHEVIELLGEAQGGLINRYFQITEAGNFEGKTIPHLSGLTAAFAKAEGKSEEELTESLASGKEKLRRERERRPKPFLDEKIIVSWNSLMISAFVKGYEVCRKTRYLSAASAAADFILDKLYHENRLLHTYKDGVANLNGYLDDTAYFIVALIDLYEASADETYLRRAVSLAEMMIEQFEDDNQGGFFYTGKDHEVLIDRTRPVYDQSLPSGNAKAAESLLRLFYHTGNKSFYEKAEKTLLAFAGEIEKNPFSAGSLVAVADFYLRKPKEIHVSGRLKAVEAENLLSKIQGLYIPNRVLSYGQSSFSSQRDWLNPPAEDDRLTVTLCEHFTCSRPMTEWRDIQKYLLG